MKKSLILMMISVILGLSVVVSASYVISVTTGESIQTAIERAPQGAVIYIAPGRYHENLLITQSVTLIGKGEDPDAVLIKSAVGRNTVTILGGQEVEVVLENLKLTSFRDDFTAGVMITGEALVELRSCFLTANGIGIVVMPGAKAVLQDSNINGNKTGLWAMRMAEVMLQDSNINGNGIGITNEGALVNLKRSTINGNVVGIQDMLEGRTTILDCTISYNFFGIMAYGSLMRVESSVISKNVNGITLMNDTLITVCRNEITLNTGYGLRTYCRECIRHGFDAARLFTGTVWGEGNFIPGPDEPYGNAKGGLCSVDYSWPEGFLREP